MDRSYLLKNKRIIVEVAIGVLITLAVFLLLRIEGYVPDGADTYGHIYKYVYLGDAMKHGVFYPLNSSAWYNGFQVFRYWTIFPYYVMALFYLISSDAIVAFYMFIAFVFAIGYIGFCLIANREDKMIYVAIGIFYFFLPDNIRLMFGEGNLSRVFICAILPLFFYFFTNLTEYKKSFVGVVVMVAIMTMSHVMIAAMCAIIFCIYGIFTGMKNRSWYLGPIAFVCGFLSAGIILLPALMGDAMNSSESGAGNSLEDWSQSLLKSLSFLHRDVDSTACSFGIVMLIIAIFIIVRGKKGHRAGAIIALIFFVFTWDKLLPVIELLPLSQAWRMLRYVQMCYILICYEFGKIEFKKRWIPSALAVLMIVDIVPSLKFFVMNNEPISKDSLVEEAVELTDSRLGVIDESRLDSYVSYYAPINNVEYVQGWAIQGASTSAAIVHFTEAVEYGCYSYAFREMLRLGCDTVVIYRDILPVGYKKSDLESAAEKYGYELCDESRKSYLFDNKKISGTYGVNISSDYLGIGTSAVFMAYQYPSFDIGDSNNLDDYTFEDLSKYKKIYLSKFTFSDKDKFEKLIRSLSDAGVEVYIDAGSLPTTQDEIANLFGVEIQTIQLSKMKNVVFDDKEYDVNVPYSWRGAYLTTDDESVKMQYFNYNDLKLGYYANIDNIHLIGMNLPYMLFEEEQAGLRDLVEVCFAMDESDLVPNYELVDVDVECDYKGITIKSQKPVCTNVAFQDNYRSDAQIEDVNHLVYVLDGTTRINYYYALFVPALVVSIIGVALTILFRYILFVKEIDLIEIINML